MGLHYKVFIHKSEIKISVFRDENHVRFSIKDNGVGIPENDINKLFRLDVKYCNPGTANETGTGLGLIIIKEFVEKHNGKIWVESTVNKGSEFMFTVPVE